MIGYLRTVGSEVKLNRLDIHPLLRRSHDSGVPPARIGWKRLLQGLVQSQFQWSVNRAFFLKHHNALLKGLDAVGLAVLLNPALAVAELAPISCVIKA